MDGRTVECSASPMRMAYSTAWRLRTGSEPGSPRHTAQTLVLGSSPKELRHEQNSLVAVPSSQWTSRPTTVSQPSGAGPLGEAGAGVIAAPRVTAPPPGRGQERPAPRAP